MIVRGKAGKPAEFGHKVTFWESREGMLVCGGIYETGNPSGSQILRAELEQLKAHGLVLASISLDRGYWDHETLGGDRADYRNARVLPEEREKEQPAG